ncbi:sensor histidine kinase [Phreatobacter stygius]|uniref:histidine kinase n=1 Tax=Phreatobacter stygius TaxID=1940610 RepID=A0A4D7ARL4_9HYPH|nr:HAMP domain-containing sensor histidine kinase [Phreatobacter stygius]QCI64024.1 HAMP domain-containing histidine kinase [Phreatobacter stygius]
MKKKARSLKWRLVWQLIALQAAVLSVIVIGVMSLLLEANISDKIMEAGAAEIVANAVSRDAAGELTLDPSPDLNWLNAEAPDFWFVVVDDRGKSLSRGTIPPAFRRMAEDLGRFSYGDIRGASGDEKLSGVIRTFQSKVGPISVLAGAGRMLSVPFVVFVLSQLLVVPLLALLALVTLVVIPVIVTRAFAGMKEIAGEAERIDIDRRGTRLSAENVPAEVAPLVNAVNDALNRLDEGYDRHKRFLADAAHELRTPIAILQTRLEDLASGPEQGRLLADIARLSLTAEQLLDLQRLDQQPCQMSPVDLVALGLCVTADLAPLAIAAGYQLSYEAGKEPVLVSGDQASLQRAVTNLIQNAIEHAGGQGTITVTVERSGCIEVSDEGPGIPAQHREQIFEPFYRLQARDHGAGLGLHLVQEVVQRHDGHVVVIDGPQGGSCFRMTLPLLS